MNAAELDALWNKIKSAQSKSAQGRARAAQ
jgi:hypothetical protein